MLVHTDLKKEKPFGN